MMAKSLLLLASLVSAASGEAEQCICSHETYVNGAYSHSGCGTGPFDHLLADVTNGSPWCDTVGRCGLHGGQMALCDPALPPSTPVGTLLEALNANPNFSRFAAWVRQTPASFGGADFEALADVLSKANSTYALLVPTNDALEEANLPLADWTQAHVSAFLRYHVVENAFPVTAPSTLNTLLGQSIAAFPSSTRNGLVLNGEVLVDPYPLQALNGLLFTLRTPLFPLDSIDFALIITTASAMAMQDGISLGYLVAYERLMATAVLLEAAGEHGVISEDALVLLTSAVSSAQRAARRGQHFNAFLFLHAAFADVLPILQTTAAPTAIQWIAATSTRPLPDDPIAPVITPMMAGSAPVFAAPEPAAESGSYVAIGVLGSLLAAAIIGLIAILCKRHKFHTFPAFYQPRVTIGEANVAEVCAWNQGNFVQVGLEKLHMATASADASPEDIAVTFHEKAMRDEEKEKEETTVMRMLSPGPTPSLSETVNNFHFTFPVTASRASDFNKFEDRHRRYASVTDDDHTVISISDSESPTEAASIALSVMSPSSIPPPPPAYSPSSRPFGLYSASPSESLSTPTNNGKHHHRRRSSNLLRSLPLLKILPGGPDARVTYNNNNAEFNCLRPRNGAMTTTTTTTTNGLAGLGFDLFSLQKPEKGRVVPI